MKNGNLKRWEFGLSVSLLMFVMVYVTSCNNEQPQIGEDLSPKEEVVCKALSEAVSDKSEDVKYLIYNADENEVYISSEEEYKFIEACVQILSTEEERAEYMESVSESGQNRGVWKYVGTANSIPDGYSIALKMMNAIPATASFLIRCEWDPTIRKYRVYYCITRPPRPSAH